MTIQTIFEARVRAIVEEYQNHPRTLIAFKGFGLEQARWLCRQPESLVPEEGMFSNEVLDLRAISEGRPDLIARLNATQSPLIAPYEAYLALRDFPERMKGCAIHIVENNLLSPWEPSLLPNETALSLFDSLQADKAPEDEALLLLSEYYGDVMPLEGGRALLLPQAPDGDIPVLPFWPETYTEDAQAPEQTVEVGAALWAYRLDATLGTAQPARILMDASEPDDSLKALGAALNALGVAFRFARKGEGEAQNAFDEAPYLALLRHYWGEGAAFRQLSFYREPDRSRETAPISQGALIAEIAEQCEAAMRGEPFRNIFITAPTGSGKSLLFQLPAIHMAEKYQAVTLIVSPLIALMNDQVNQLVNERSVSMAACLNSSMTVEERLTVMAQIQSGEKLILYLAPELLLTTHLASFLGGRRLGMVVVDEAHTVTSWGRDFRSDYWFLGDFLKKCRRDGMRFPVLCLTATAVYSGEDDVVNDTLNELGLEKTLLHIGSVRRENIGFDIQRHGSGEVKGGVEAAKMALTVQRLKKYVSAGEKVLAYFPYRSQVDDIYRLLDSRDTRLIRRYHSRIAGPERKMTEINYRAGDALGLVCTKAFGMGVDVDDIQHVIHFAPTGTLSDYVQEIGRAARRRDIQGTAHIDYFPSDLRYVKALNGISEMRQYQLREMLKKLCGLYDAQKSRNLLVSSESFEYLFDEAEVENRTKSGLMLLAKDLQSKYGFPVLVVRPQAMLTHSYVDVPLDLEEMFLKKYGGFATLQGGQNRRVETSTRNGRQMETVIYSQGNTYLLDMAGIWERFFPEYAFGMFRKVFFETEVPWHGTRTRLVAPRVRVEIRYQQPFEEVAARLNAVLTALVEQLAQFKGSEQKHFTVAALEKALNERMGEKPVAHDKFGLFVDVFSETVDAAAAFNQARSQVRVLRRRIQPGFEEPTFFVSNNAYARLPGYFDKMLRECVPDETDNAFQRFYPHVANKQMTIMPMLQLLELLDLASYEIRGGEKAEIFVRVNDPLKLRRLAESHYRNAVLQAIQARHRRSQDLLAAFFTTPMDTQERWDLIEAYFLGEDDAVHARLGLTDEA